MLRMKEHLSKRFDADLEHIRTGVLQMGGQVETQLAQAMQGLKTGDLPLLERVIDEDHRINLTEIELDEACSHIIAKRQPAAVDLRMILTVIKIISDLERVGDEAKKIAKAARRLHAGDTNFMPRVELNHAATLATEMLRKSLDSFARLDISSAADIVRQDAEVDACFKGVMRQLITFMMEDPRTISHALDVLFIAKAIERVGDHAKNISEYMVFMVSGRDVRHAGAEAIEQEAAKR